MCWWFGMTADDYHAYRQREYLGYCTTKELQQRRANELTALTQYALAKIEADRKQFLQTRTIEILLNQAQQERRQKAKAETETYKRVCKVKDMQRREQADLERFEDELYEAERLECEARHKRRA